MAQTLVYRSLSLRTQRTIIVKSPECQGQGQGREETRSGDWSLAVGLIFGGSGDWPLAARLAQGDRGNWSLFSRGVSKDHLSVFLLGLFFSEYNLGTYFGILGKVVGP